MPIGSGTEAKEGKRRGGGVFTGGKRDLAATGF